MPKDQRINALMFAAAGVAVALAVTGGAVACLEYTMGEHTKGGINIYDKNVNNF